MDLQLDKSRLNRWARLLRTYLIRHQQCEIKHTNAISAIAAMLDYPNANTLTATLKREPSVPAGRAGNDQDDRRPDDGRQLHEISWAWSDPPSVFQTYAWMTDAEARRLVHAINEIAEEYGDLADVAAGPRPLDDGKAWYGNLTALVEAEIKEAFESQLDDPDSTASRVIPALCEEPAAPPRRHRPIAAGDGRSLDAASNQQLIAELRRRGCMACVFEPTDVAPRISRHPGVRFADLGPEADPEAMSRAQDWLFDNEDKIEAALTSCGNDKIDSLLEDQDEIPDLPEIADEIHSGAVSGKTATIAELCENQPHLDDGVYRVVGDSGQVSLIERAGAVWQLAERRLPEWAPPRVGELVRFDQAPDAHIVVEQVPSPQPYYADDIYTVVDQYGETHHVEGNDDGWTVLTSLDHLD